MFGKPQAYSQFLGREIQFQFVGHLLVAMPQGLGLSYQGGKRDPQAGKVAGTSIASGADGAAEAAIRAIPQLASVGSGSVSSGGGIPTEAIVAVVALGVVLVGALVVVVLLRQREAGAGAEGDAER
jgi:hypothetical protein